MPGKPVPHLPISTQDKRSARLREERVGSVATAATPLPGRVRRVSKGCVPADDPLPVPTAPDLDPERPSDPAAPFIQRAEPKKTATDLAVNGNMNQHGSDIRAARGGRGASLSRIALYLFISISRFRELPQLVTTFTFDIRLP